MNTERLVDSFLPLGGVDRLRELGYDLSRTASCAPENRSGGIRGCPYWKSCPFHLPEYGGFKGTRPHNIGYHLRTDAGRKEDIAACFVYTGALLYRQRAGEVAAIENRPGEFVQVVAQEGEPVLLKVIKPVDPNNNKSGNVQLKLTRLKTLVPVFPDPTVSDPDIQYENELMDMRRIQNSQRAAALSGMGGGPLKPLSRAELMEQAAREANPQISPAPTDPGLIVPLEDPLAALDTALESGNLVGAGVPGGITLQPPGAATPRAVPTGKKKSTPAAQGKGKHPK